MAVLVSIIIDVVITMTVEMTEQIVKAETDAYESAEKFECTFRDDEHPDAPWGCMHEFPGPDDCDGCPFAKGL